MANQLQGCEGDMDMVDRMEIVKERLKKGCEGDLVDTMDIVRGI